ncbi:MAG: winged helix-turn-helix transcriptional regulator [Clostridiales bacterium]|nr:winged helix-turn-helix transcriptional regulator [Clostridiales bacterium]
MEKEMPRCAEHHDHGDILEDVKSTLPNEDALYDLAELFKIFGDSTRIRILYVLHEKEVCVCDIAEILGMTLSAISHQLRILKTSRLVKYRKEGKTVYYSLADDHVKTVLGMGMEHILEKQI